MSTASDSRIFLDLLYGGGVALVLDVLVEERDLTQPALGHGRYAFGCKLPGHPDEPAVEGGAGGYGTGLVRPSTLKPLSSIVFSSYPSLLCTRPRTLFGHGFPHRGDDFVRKELNLPGVVFGRPVDEGVHPKLHGEPCKLLDPVLHGPVE
jgi:hypothetical protein